MNDPQIAKPSTPFTLLIPGNPAAQPRHQIAVRGKFATAFIPAKNPIHAWKRCVEVVAINARVRNLRLTGPIGVTIEFNLARPAYHHFGDDLLRPIRNTAPNWHTSKPDIDNLEKAILDALAGLNLFDVGDQQVCQVIKRKRYAENAPFCSVTITQLTE